MNVVGASTGWTWTMRMCFAAWGSFIGMRLFLISKIPTPYFFADETVAFSLARFIGGQPAEFSGPTGRPLFGLLLAPFAALGGSARLMHVAGLLIATLAYSLIGPVVYALGTRTMGYGRDVAAMSAVIASGGAATVAFSTTLMPESLLALISVSGVGAFLWMADNPTTARVVLVPPLVSVVAASAHPRGDVFAMAAVLAILVGVFGKSIPQMVGAISIGGCLAATAAVRALSAAVNETVYPLAVRVDYSSSGVLTDAVSHPDLVARSLIGTTWYAALSSAGLLVVGAFGLLAAATKKRDRLFEGHTFSALLVAGGFALSAIFVSSIIEAGFRVDSFAYGRYAEHLFPVLALYLPMALRSRAVSLAAGAGTAGILIGGSAMGAILYDDSYWSGTNLQSFVSGISFLWWPENPMTPLGILPAALGISLLATVGLQTRFRGLVAITISIGTASTGLVLGLNELAPFAEFRERWAPSGQYLEDIDAVDVAIPLDQYGTADSHLVMFWAPNVDFDIYNSTSAIDSDAQWLLTRSDGLLPEGRTGTVAFDNKDASTLIWRLDPPSN